MKKFPKMIFNNKNGIELSTISSVMLLMFVLLFSYSSFVVAAENLPFYDTPEFTPRWIDPGSEELNAFHQIPAFNFIDQEGRKISRESMQGKVYVAQFFFTSCPGICITMRSKLAMVQDAFAGDSDVKILSHSIRPSSDTVDVLKEYAQKYGINSEQWHLLTGNRESIYQLAKSAYFAHEDLGSLTEVKDILDFLHTENLLLIDQNFRIRGVYNGLSAASVSYLIDDIKILKSEFGSLPL